MANENVINRKSVKITLRDDKEYTIQPLTIDELIEVLPLIVKLEDRDQDLTVELLEDVKELVHKGLKGQVDKDKVGSLVDLSDLKVIIAGIVGQNQKTIEALMKND